MKCHSERSGKSTGLNADFPSVQNDIFYTPIYLI